MGRIEPDRRSVLAALGGSLATPALAAQASQGAFRHGVAAGDPGLRGAVLWTRLTPLEGGGASMPLELSVAEDRDDAPPLLTRKLVAEAGRDFTVKLTLDDALLAPGSTYRYRFSHGEAYSPIGRFRTLPAGHIDRLTLAVACCALYPGGYFHAYRAIADLAQLDAVVFLGDYIYEYAPAGYGAASGRQTGRIPVPDRECVSLADYRARFAQARSDPDLQAAHTRAAWICAWDDHELANDAARDGAQNHQPASEGDWADRKAAAIRAYYEWMPIREPAGGPTANAWRSFAFGDLARLIMLETRLTGRDRQLSFARSSATAETVAAFRAHLDDPARRMLGADQEVWLDKELAASVAGEAWQVLGSGVLMARARQIDLMAALGPERFAKLTAAQRRTALVADLPYLLDAWDGYPAARERLYRQLRTAKARPLVLSGDTHNFWMNRLHDAEGQPLGAELGVGPISSPASAAPTAPAGLDAQALFVAQNLDIEAYRAGPNGFGLVTLTREGAQCDWIGVSSVLEPSGTSAPLARFAVAREGRGEIRSLSL